ncbi:hypothetical protein BJ741DRAFT_633883 [Chytriomyces cf. hyalinus JEL632]|nr:hypothetical protein BJ741DRAFT_633883 [Chytriomyces cf. hyalinus JEL632]
MLATITLTLIAAVSSVSAHLEMLTPLPRNVGTMPDQQIGPCANAPTPANRVPFSTLQNNIVLAFYWDGSNDIFLGFGSNPTTFPYKIGALPNAKMGETYTVPLDLTSVPAELLTSGGEATIQVVCHQPKFDIYQCADVTLEANTKAVVPSKSNSTVSASAGASKPMAMSTGAAAAATTVAKTSDASPVSVVKAGLAVLVAMLL